MVMEFVVVGVTAVVEAGEVAAVVIVVVGGAVLLGSARGTTPGSTVWLGVCEEGR